VAVKVLTGDNELVTAKICREVGLEQQGLLMGNDIERMSDAELAVAVEHTNVFAKLTPSHKERIVRVAQGQRPCGRLHGRRHQRCAALRTADIGISVDSAVDIAKEAADIILLEKSLMVLEERARRAADLRQHAQVHQDDGQLQLRQRVLGAGGQCVHSVPADAADAPAGAEPALRHFADRHSVRQRR
jgi:cation transport ATPase